MNLADKNKVVYLINTADYNSGVDGDSINMKGIHRATIIFLFGAITGDAILYIYSGATNAAKTSALTFKYKYGGAACGSTLSDVYSTESTSAALTLTGTTYANRCLICEIDASAMDLANNEEWLTVSLSDAASAGILHTVAILEPRYSDGATSIV